ncbi:hypothetical protein M422DRAFT_256207 [Sphaerobolus stellatus SS14]|uniref:Unplaced genomic scaffold SPHSTscaffold_66, whole genome shotgun sequence n=1 Tax=Sphaerobolus stellatus (strain SS14) TaxID=990650 RepID=A0A0C9VR40_SPHS4|nr:hypothetical protein M422DRAFT_256207 [Sphaerobolus stellatus SS14]
MNLRLVEPPFVVADGQMIVLINPRIFNAAAYEAHLSNVRLVDSHICKASTYEAHLSNVKLVDPHTCKASAYQQVHIKCIYSNMRLVDPHICKASAYQVHLFKYALDMHLLSITVRIEEPTSVETGWGTSICPSLSGGCLLLRSFPFSLHHLLTPSEPQDPEDSHAHPAIVWPAGTSLTAAAPILPLHSLIFPYPVILHDEGTPLNPGIQLFH